MLFFGPLYIPAHTADQPCPMFFVPVYSYYGIGGSPQALELVQDSKATIFLVLELARGGELFDRIKVRGDV